MTQVPFRGRWSSLFALIDDEDSDRVLRLNWRIKKSKNTNYALTHVRRKDGGYSSLGLHKLIMNSPLGFEVDHVDGNGLNCQKYNLRVCTTSQNQMNSSKDISSGVTSKFKGVYYFKRDGKYKSQVSFEGKQFYIGMFESELEAASAYNIVARKLFGLFGKLNVLDVELVIESAVIRSEEIIREIGV